MPLFLYRIEPVRADMPLSPTAEERELIGQHFAHLKAGFEQGMVQFVGRTSEAPFLGIAILDVAERAQAEAFLAADPAVAGNVFKGLVQAYDHVMPSFEPRR